MKRFDLRYLCAAPAVAAVLFVGSAALAADCHDNGSFEAWLERFKAEAVKQGISRNVIAAAGPYLVYDQRIVNIDHGQRIFAQSFLDFSGKMLPAYRLQQGAAQIKKNQAVFDRAEKQYGRAGRGDHRFLGARERLRLQPGQGQLDQVAHHARL
jgi:membrane-bound lytic murein transglycosylase B